MESGGEEAVWPPGKGPCSALSFLCSVPVLVGFFFFCFFVSGCPLHVEVPRPGVELELQLPAQQCRLLNPQPLGSQSDLLTTELGQELPF